MNKTAIEWTHWSVNPFKLRMPDGTLINFCIHKSEGCRFCYAEGIVRRWWKKEWGEFPGYTASLQKLGTPVLVEDELLAMLRLNERIAKGKADPNINRVFWNDMTDEYLEFWPDEFIDRLWAVRALTPNLIHQVLTKRPDRLLEYMNGNGFATRRCRVAEAAQTVCDGDDRLRTSAAKPYSWWPLSNAHVGISCEDQQTADERIPRLLQTPAAVHWISAEPLLGPINLNSIACQGAGYFDSLSGRGHDGVTPDDSAYPSLDWVVVGGESGPKARPFDLAWGRSLVSQCNAASVPVFVKQLGARPERGVQVSTIGEPLHGDFFPLRLRDKKGGDTNEWPEDLRVREFPSSNTV